MFVDVERHESTDRGDAVERVEEEPLMCERAPPRLDHGIRELQLREGQHSTQDTARDQVVDLSVYVLDPSIRHDDRGGVRARGGPTGVEQDGHARPRRERRGDSPRPDASREKLSITACREARVPSSKRMTVVSICHISPGRVVRSPVVGFAGCTRSRGRRQPNRRTRSYQGDAEAQTVPSRWARTASVPVGT